MNKTVQVILISVALSLGISARLLLEGWMAMIGYGTIALFGGMHLLVHFYSMYSIATNWASNVVLSVLSHYLLLNLFFFQLDADDSKSYLVVEYVFGEQHELTHQYSSYIFWISFGLYLIVGAMLMINARKQRKVKVNVGLLAGVVVAVFCMSTIMLNIFRNYKERQFEIQSEAPKRTTRE